MLAGEVELSTPQGSVVITNGERAVAQAGLIPVKTAVLNANNVIQWNLYYPAVLDPAQIGFTLDEQRTLGKSISAYRDGDLPKALQEYPVGRAAASDAERVFLAELLLSAGLVDQSETQLNFVNNHPAVPPA